MQQLGAGNIVDSRKRNGLYLAKDSFVSLLIVEEAGDHLAGPFRPLLAHAGNCDRIAAWLCRRIEVQRSGQGGLRQRVRILSALPHRLRKLRAVTCRRFVELA